MGRVYNALVKADRLTDRQRPIGRPAVQDPQTQRYTDNAIQPDLSGIPHFDSDDDNPTAPVGFDDSFTLSDTFVTERTAEPFIAPPSVEPFVSSPHISEKSMRGDASRDSASSVSLPIKPIFVEPREVINVKNLSLDSRWAALTNSDALAIERYRTLAVRVTRRKLKTLMITSAENSEGKSTIAANLAWVMAKREGKRVLLIDGSLRGHTLGLPAGRGWLEMRDVSSEMADTIVRLDPNGLYLMRAGGTDSNDFDMDDALASAQFEKIVAELAGYFDFIVIDAPTICGSAGAQQLASIADGTVVVARAGRTHHSRVMRAVELVPQERRLGIVLNESEVSQDIAPRNSGNASIIRRLFGRKY
jgi:capsular exopolysaccharide synthesis family protein